MTIWELDWPDIRPLRYARVTCSGCYMTFTAPAHWATHLFAFCYDCRAR